MLKKIMIYLSSIVSRRTGQNLWKYLKKIGKKIKNKRWFQKRVHIYLIIGNLDFSLERFSLPNQINLIQVSDCSQAAHIFKTKKIKGLFILKSLEDLYLDSENLFLKELEVFQLVKRAHKIPAWLVISNMNYLYGFESFPHEEMLPYFSIENLNTVIDQLLVIRNFRVLKEKDEVIKPKIYHLPTQMKRFIINFSKHFESFEGIFKTFYICFSNSSDINHYLFFTKDNQPRIIQYNQEHLTKMPGPKKAIEKILISICSARPIMQKALWRFIFFFTFLVFWISTLSLLYQNNVHRAHEITLNSRILVESLNKNMTFNQSDQLNALIDTLKSRTKLQRYSSILLSLGLSQSNNLLPEIDNIIALAIERGFLKPEANHLENLLKKEERAWKIHQAQTYYPDAEAYLSLCRPLHISFSEKSAVLARRWVHFKQLSPLANLIASIYLSKLFHSSGDFWLNPWKCQSQLIHTWREELKNCTQSKDLWSVIKPRLKVQLGSSLLSQLVGHTPFYSDHFIANLYLPKNETRVKQDIEEKIEHIKKYGDPILNQTNPMIDGDTINHFQQQTLFQKILWNYQQDRFLAREEFFKSIRLQPLHSFIAADNMLRDLSKNRNFLDRMNQFAIKMLKLDKIKIDLTLYKKHISDLQKDLKTLKTSQKLYRYIQDTTDQKNQINHINSLLLDIRFVTSRLSIKNSLIFRKILSSPVQVIWQFILKKYERLIQNDWENQIWPVYQQNIQHRFPFEINNQVVNYGDIQEFFKENGSFWQFVHKRLIPFINPPKNLSLKMNFTQNFIKKIEVARIIQKIFCSNKPLDFDIYPVPIYNVTRTEIRINDQSISYENGPQQWKKFHWDFKELNPNIQITIRPTVRYKTRTMQFNGAFALFRFIQKASIQYQENQIYRLIWIFNHPYRHMRLTLLIRVHKQQDFIRLLLKGFQLQKRLFL